MATNPMQKKARNSFILGVLITFVIMAMIVAVLLIQVKNMKEEEQARLSNTVKVCVLKSDVTSGQIITNGMITTITVDKNTVPANATSSVTNLESYFLEDKSGNSVVTNEGKTYLQIDGLAYELKSEDATGYYYIERNQQKEYVELATPPLLAKINMKANTVVTNEMLVKSDDKTTKDLRIQEYNMLQLASQIAVDDYIDIRFRLPSGQDYIVVSKKKVEVPQIDGVDSTNTIWLQLTEDEILAMSNAIVENYIVEGSLLYTTKYVEPGTQEKAIPTYVPSAEVQTLMRDNDPNILDTAKMELLTRYNSNTNVRNSINDAKNRVDSDDAQSNVSTGVKKEVSTAQEQRQSYLDALAGN